MIGEGSPEVPLYQKSVMVGGICWNGTGRIWGWSERVKD